MMFAVTPASLFRQSFDSLPRPGPAGGARSASHDCSRRSNSIMAAPAPSSTTDSKTRLARSLYRRMAGDPEDVQNSRGVDLKDDAASYPLLGSRSMRSG